jgi:hypothetical protein
MNASQRLDQLRSELDSLSSPRGAGMSIASSVGEALALLLARGSSGATAASGGRRSRRRGLLRAGVTAIGATTRLVSRVFRRRRPSPVTPPEPSRLPLRRTVIGGITPPRQRTGVSRNSLIGSVLPMLLTAGVADWMRHRRARIARHAGPRESALHLLMLGEAALPVLAGLFLEITSPVLLLMFGATVAHAATALWHVSAAAKRRGATPEQRVHSYLEMVPVMAVGLISALHWPETRALFGFGTRSRDWSLRTKQRPLPKLVVAGLLGSVALEVLPYLEELWRSRGARR